MNRKGRVPIVVVLVCMMLITLVASCDDPDSVLALSSEDQKTVILELFLAFQYGADDDSEETLFNEGKVSMEFVLGDKPDPEDCFKLDSLQFIKVGAQISAEATREEIAAGKARIEVRVLATGSHVFGGSALLELVLYEYPNELTLSSITLNGMEIPYSRWPDFGDYVDFTPDPMLVPIPPAPVVEPSVP